MKPNKTEKHHFWLPYWERYLKKIPKRGLNNLTRKTSWHNRKGEPTIRRRLKKIVAIGMFTQAPPFLHYAGDMITFGKEKENLPKIKELTKQIIQQLEELYSKMDTVKVIPKKEVEYWKQKIKETTFYIKEQSKWIGLAQEAKYRVLE